MGKWFIPNKCVIIFDVGKSMAFVTKYIYKKRIDEDNTLLVNTLTSAIDVIDNATNTFLDNNNKDNNGHTIDEQTFNLLVKRGYIFNSEEEEANVRNKMFFLSKNFSLSRLNTSFTICPTMGCNLRCTYCFESNAQHCNDEALTDDQLRVIFQYIQEQCRKFKEVYDKAENKEGLKAYAPKINLFGGEPLLIENKEIIVKILSFAKNMNIPVKIITNGTTIDFYYDIKKEYKELLSFQITVDGYKNIHDQRRIYADGTGTFERICDAIDKVLSLGLHVSLRINVDKENINDLDKLQQVCLESYSRVITQAEYEARNVEQEEKRVLENIKNRNKSKYISPNQEVDSYFAEVRTDGIKKTAVGLCIALLAFLILAKVIKK